MSAKARWTPRRACAEVQRTALPAAISLASPIWKIRRRSSSSVRMSRCLRYDLVKLRAALARYSAATVLWVHEAVPGHLPGTAEQATTGCCLAMCAGWRRARTRTRSIIVLAQRLSPGLRALASGAPPAPIIPAPIIPAPIIRALPARAAAPIMPAPPVADTAPAQPTRTEIIFGQGGNSEPHLALAGPRRRTASPGRSRTAAWSRWTRRRQRDRYVLDMEVDPFHAPPLLPRQRLLIAVNGEPVHNFDSAAARTGVVHRSRPPGRRARFGRDPAGAPRRRAPGRPVAAGRCAPAGDRVPVAVADGCADE